MNRTVLWVIAVLGVLVMGLAYFNIQGGAKRWSSQQDATLFIIANGEEVATVTFDDVRSLEQHRFGATLRSSDAQEQQHTYQGILLSDLLMEHDLNVRAEDQVIVRAADGYTVTVTGEDVLQEDNVYLVYEKNGERMRSREAGGSGPYQLIVRKDDFGQRWNKHVMEIEMK